MIKSKLDTMEESISELEDESIVTIQSEVHRERNYRRKWTKSQWPLRNYKFVKHMYKWNAIRGGQRTWDRAIFEEIMNNSFQI